MTEPRCALTELPVSMCAHCRPNTPKPESAYGPDRLVAIYHSTCPSCGEHISPGDYIVHPSAGCEGWTCEECGT